MVDFRRWITALAVLALFAGLASAQINGGGGTGLNTPFTCGTQNVSVTPTLRSEGFTEEVGDIVLTCQGGASLVPGAVIPTANITVFLNNQVTSRILNGNGSSSSNASEALLLIDEPGSGLVPPVATPGFGPQAPQRLCGSAGTTGNALTGCTEYVTNLNGVVVATDVNNGTGLVTTAAPGANMFQGVVSGNSVTFFGVPILPPVTTGTSRVYRITNIRVNANGIGAGGQAIASISLNGATSVPITQPTLIVGFVQQGLTTSLGSGTAGSFQQCNSSVISGGAASTESPAFGFTGTLNFKEGFGTAFKTRVQPQSAASFSGQLAAVNQNIPGTIYNGESNFVQTSVLGTANIAGVTATAGLADFGTRLKAVFNNVPSGVSLFVSVANNGGTNANPGNNSTTPYALLVNGETVGDGSGAPPLALPTNTINSVPVALVPLTNNTGTAVWEVVNTSPSSIETLSFNVWAAYTSNTATNTPPPGTATVNMSFAPTPPIFTAAAGAVASSSLPIPRFADTSSPTNFLTVNVCRTILLYPYVTTASGLETGIAISNTTVDPLGTAAQNGTCSLNWFQGTTNPPATATGTITAGTTYTTLASTNTGGPGNFTGYMIAVCNFQFAHGFAFISDAGLRNLAMGYLALVIPDPGSAKRASNDLSKSVLGAGEQLGY
jgi:hypothetical protein